MARVEQKGSLGSSHHHLSYDTRDRCALSASSHEGEKACKGIDSTKHNVEECAWERRTASDGDGQSCAGDLVVHGMEMYERALGSNGVYIIVMI